MTRRTRTRTGHRIGRRSLLRGIGGATLALPLLESFGRADALAQALDDQRFALFFRQANGVASEQNSPLSSSREPERFWPHNPGPITPESLSGRAVDELTDYRDRILIVDRLNMSTFNYGDGHANGAMQGLTASGPTVTGAGGASEAAGVSIDHLIGAELNTDGRESLYMYAGRNGGWLGGPCISYRASGTRRAAFRNPKAAYEAVFGVASMEPEAADLLANRRKSINDLVRGQLTRLMGHPRLGQQDRMRLQLHFDSVRDLETKMACRMDDAKLAELSGGEAFYDSGNGPDVVATTQLHMDVAALAIACGYTRSVAIQVGNGNDGNNRYLDPDTGNLMENYHYISHRRLSHDDTGNLIAGSDLLHHKVDRQFGQMFRYLLDRLSEYALPDGNSLLQQGASIWYNDNGNGPGHSNRRIPFIIAGSAGGRLKQGQTLDLGSDQPNHIQALRTVARAVGVTSNLDGFGDGSLPKGFLSALET